MCPSVISMRELVWDSAFNGVKGEGLGFYGSLFIGEFKTERWEFKIQKEKTKQNEKQTTTKVSQMVSYLNKSRSKTKRLKGGLALNLVVWLAMSPFKITVPEVDAVFEMGVSLKRMPQQSKLSQTLTLQIEKQLSGLPLQSLPCLWSSQWK